MAHVEKRGPKRYRARYRAPNGHERSKTFERKVDAERWLAQIETSKIRGEWRDPVVGRVTYQEWADRYFAGALHKRPTTLARDKIVDKKWFSATLGPIPISAITPLDVQRAVRAMADKLAPATVRTHYGVLRAIMTAAVHADLIAVSPCRGVSLPADPGRNLRFLSAAELKQLADAMPAEYQPMVYLAGVLGLRWSEVAGLRIGRIDFLRRTLSVVETCAEVDGKVMFADVKTRSSRRTLAIPTFLVDLLAEHVASTERRDAADLLFTAPEGGPLRRSTFRARVWEPAVRRAGLHGVTFHGLRHSAVGLMIEVGAHIEAIKQRLGHSSIRTTSDVYGSLLPAVDEAVTSRLEGLFSLRSTDAQCSGS